MSFEMDLSSFQLRDVQDVLRRPLTGRRAMIPLGTKAFVPGKLQPTLEQDQQEMIQLRDSKCDDLRSVTRKEAIDCIQEEILMLQRPSKPTPAANTPEKASHTNVTLPRPLASNPASDMSESFPAPAFFEIREELDEKGKEVRSEAVNIADHLKLWEREVAAADAENTGKRPMSALQENDYVQPFTEPDEPRKEISDQEYETLTARLDELARLEEEGGKTKTVNTKSSKNLQSRGWAKGFLNNSAKSKRETKSKAAESQTIPLAQIAPPETGTEACSDNRHANLSADTDSSNRLVSFADANQVQEIPRLGHRSVKEIQRPASLVSETVLERPRKGRQQSRSTNTTQQATDQPQKKLSRFAHQRMGKF